MTRGLAVLCMALVATPAFGGEGVDLVPFELGGILDDGGASRLRGALADARRRGHGLLLVVDSPGGRIDAAEKAMITVLFAGVPVVAFVPDGGQAAGAALFPLMGSDMIGMAPTAHLGSRRGLGREGHLALGPFGDRLFAAARESRSGSVDWMIVSLSDGGRIDARGAKRRGVTATIAPDHRALVRALGGQEVTVPLTGEVATLSGRLARATTSGPSGFVVFWRRPVPLACLLVLALCLFAWGATRASCAALFPVAVVALGIVLRASDDLPLGREATLLVGIGAILLAFVPTGSRGSLFAVLAGPLLAIGCLVLMDVEADGWFLDESARVPAVAASTIAALFVLASLVVRRVGPEPERWRPLPDPVELPPAA
ncbi:MAG: hypothetical protein HYY06_29280 [Deltaproteobacteria bacterium]|nr:hypothetical protein [Deltaproteobacteria bacterium]